MPILSSKQLFVIKLHPGWNDLREICWVLFLMRERRVASLRFIKSHNGDVNGTMK